MLQTVFKLMKSIGCKLKSTHSRVITKLSWLLPSGTNVKAKNNLPRLLADWEIEEHGIVWPHIRGQYRPGEISWGDSGFGYDFRLGYRFAIFKTPHALSHERQECMSKPKILDPKNFDRSLVEEFDLTGMIDTGEPVRFLLPAFGYVLAEQIERFHIPDDTLTIVLAKSTYARCGVVLNVTPGEPSWSGRLTLEIFNASPWPVWLYCGEGIGQAIFLSGNSRPRQTYNDKKGKYQNQDGLQYPIVKKD